MHERASCFGNKPAQQCPGALPCMVCLRGVLTDFSFGGVVKTALLADMHHTRLHALIWRGWVSTRNARILSSRKIHGTVGAGSILVHLFLLPLGSR